MEKKLCYIVQTSMGQYEDHRIIINGIFLNAIDAESLKNKIEFYYIELKNIPAPFAEKELPILSDEQYDEYYKWQANIWLCEELNYVEVKEFPLNTEIK